MAEYIECITKHRAKTFVCALCNEHCWDDPCEPSDCEWMAAIESEPAADVVAVVRCRDCKYYGDTAYGDMCKRWEDWLPTEDDDSCSYGERRGDNAR